MSTYMVILKSGKTISVQENWIKNPILDEKTLIFFSPNKNDAANFCLQKKYFFSVFEKFESKIQKEVGP